MAQIRIKRGTRAQIDSAASAGGLLIGEPYLITDEGRLALATAVDAYDSYVREGEYLRLLAGYGEAADTVASAGTAQTISLDGKSKLLTLDQALCTISLSVPAGVSVANAAVCYTQDASGGRAIADPAGIEDDADTPVTINSSAGKKTMVLYWTLDGGASYQQSLIWSQE